MNENSVSSGFVTGRPESPLNWLSNSNAIDDTRIPNAIVTTVR